MIIIARFTFELTAPMHCGGGEKDFQEERGLLDAPVLRDALGFWCLPGSSVAGVLRARTRQAYGPEAEKRLFGCAEGDGTASLVWCSDAVLLDWDGKKAAAKCLQGGSASIGSPSFVRDHVRISDETGAAERGGKFDEEYVPAGTRFAAEIALDSWGGTLGSRDLSVFAALMRDLEAGRVQFGGKSGTGYGWYRTVSLDIRSFDLTKAAELDQWLALDDAPAFPRACGTVWNPAGQQPAESAETLRGLCGTIALPLRAQAPVLIGGGSDPDCDANFVFATTACCDQAAKAFVQRCVVPGSSLKGVVRHRFLTVARALGIADPQALVNAVFGSLRKGGEDEKDAGRSRIAVSDADLMLTRKNSPCDPKGSRQSIPHVAIDRFTGGAMDGHLFSEAPVWAEDLGLTLRVRVDGLTDLQAAVLMQALLDLALGEAALGGGDNRGNGRFRLDPKGSIDCELSRGGQVLELHGAPASLGADALKTAKEWLAAMDSAIKSARGSEDKEQSTC
ncbi:MAG: RAMP superfamily CRISPR-associated protein [Desulfovibrionaceae bacterium]|nr:RAMP superfamily CRISPR-associated protein [Desulfovibrionaceae bacterium]